MSSLLSADVAFAAAAGTLAAVNPCGFAMLPAYLVLFGSSERDRDAAPAAALGRALSSAATMTAGFVAVFGAFGLLLIPVASSVQQWAPAVTAVVGAVLAVLGLLMLGGRNIGPRLPGLHVAGLGAGATSSGARARVLFLYGVSYALTSLGCAIGPFLAVVATTLRSGDVIDGMAAYAAYAIGMGAVVALLAVTTALAHRSTARPFRLLAPYSARIGGALLVLVGAYVTWFGAYEIRVRAGADPEDPVIANAGSIQAAIARGVDRLGPTAIVLALVALAIVLVVTGTHSRRRATKSPP